MAKALLALCFLLYIAACSDKDSDMPFPLAQPDQQNTETTQSKSNETENEEVVDTENPLPLTEESQTDRSILDTEVAIIMQAYKDELIKQNLSDDRKIPNVEFANRISKINFKYSNKSSLKLYTHTQRSFNFKYIETKNNVQHFASHEGANTIIYKAEVRPLKVSPKKLIALIKIIDVPNRSVVQFFYVKRTGQIEKRLYDSNIDYSKNLKAISKRFIQRLIERPDVTGEFFEVITENPNVSNASHFKLTISDNFILESQPLASFSSVNYNFPIPLKADSKSSWRTLCGVFCNGGVSYIAASDFTYSPHEFFKAIELNVIQINFKLDATERAQQKSTLPYGILIKFK